ncbi:MAG: glycine zipper 2TM domain-containing protein [Gammaproteobacteria bacterium]
MFKLRLSHLRTSCALALASLAIGVQAAPAHRHDDQRYEDARHACDNERNQGQRKKCLRELERDHPRLAENGTQGHGKAQHCSDCGRVLGVRSEKRDGDSNALGVVAGGAAGALLGHQVGGGNGKTLATIAGAVGGAYAGKKIQEKANATRIWTVDVEYDNGRRGSVRFDRDPGLQRGDRVQKAGASLRRL